MGTSYTGSYTGSSYTGSSYTGSSSTGSSYTRSSSTGSSYAQGDSHQVVSAAQGDSHKVVSAGTTSFDFQKIIGFKTPNEVPEAKDAGNKENSPPSKTYSPADKKYSLTDTFYKRVIKNSSKSLLGSVADQTPMQNQEVNTELPAGAIFSMDSD